MGRSKKTAQYTIRSVPTPLDKALRQRARREGKSLNEAAIEALRRGLGLDGQENINHDLDDFIGSWIEDPAFDEAIEAQDVVDEDRWK